MLVEISNDKGVEPHHCVNPEKGPAERISEAPCIAWNQEHICAPW